MPRDGVPADRCPSAAGRGVQVGVPEPVPGGAQVGMGHRVLLMGGHTGVGLGTRARGLGLEMGVVLQGGKQQWGHSSPG